MLKNPNFPSEYQDMMVTALRSAKEEQDESKKEQMLLKAINSIRDGVTRAIMDSVKDEVSINNLDEVKGHLRTELSKAFSPLISEVKNLRLSTETLGKLRVDDILAPYKITDKDDDASPNYYGFTKADGSWYILKETVSAGADTYRYAKGGSDYTTNWTNRAGLSVDYFYNVF